VGRVTDHLLSLIQKQVEDRGIVVWYDPDRAYGDVAPSLSLPDVAVLRFEGSFFALREQLEPFLEFVDEAVRPKTDTGVPPRVLIYVPAARRDTHFALIEAESAGVVMEPGATPWQRNTRLRVVAERVFKDIAHSAPHRLMRWRWSSRRPTGTMQRSRRRTRCQRLPRCR
jgi:hypothetical protein